MYIDYYSFDSKLLLKYYYCIIKIYDNCWSFKYKQTVKHVGTFSQFFFFTLDSSQKNIYA